MHSQCVNAIFENSSNSPCLRIGSGKEMGVSELQTEREKRVSKQGTGREKESQKLDQNRKWVSNIGSENKMGLKYWTQNLGTGLHFN